MWNKEQQEVWDDIKNMWNESSQSKAIKIDMSQLVVELKNKTSQFEKDAIKWDIEMIKGSISQFEKDSIKSDIALITSVVKKFVAKLKGKKD
ncbi:hypothetical protein GWK08_08605 [Leptobacterium flavescens]|uniref:Uncharacterized protein n=1 Tax=Leptobacterium flavescens TaxID=472055 RepID=A0A6P0UJU5_9FLAO|nr:hypothetical protein [Leptobacterium flavescens]NER13494.1 hypothetical protein [Leptobacterium flavescens]